MKKSNKLILKVFICLYIIVLIVIQINIIMFFSNIFTGTKIESGVYLKHPFYNQTIYYPDEYENTILIKKYNCFYSDIDKVKAYNYWKKNDDNTLNKYYKEIYDLLGKKGKTLINSCTDDISTLFSLNNYYYVVKNKTKNKYKDNEIIKELLIFNIEDKSIYLFSVIKPQKYKER